MAYRFSSMLAMVTVSIAACQSPQAGWAARDWDKFVSGFVDTYLQANPLFAVYQGRHEFDGRFPDWSDAGLQKWIRRLHQLRDSAAAFPIDSSDMAR
ncbi:MAG: hypothetical protein K0S19_1214, partial [Geminicoccaceae bacterium]|nr:hypothetical protein [Geminicoccaceae bacterium]